MHSSCAAAAKRRIVRTAAQSKMSVVLASVEPKRNGYMLFAAIPDTAARAVVDTVRDPLPVLDHDLRIVAASRTLRQTFQFAGREIPGQPSPTRHSTPTSKAA
jgi:hypothetical protein